MNHVKSIGGKSGLCSFLKSLLQLVNHFDKQRGVEEAINFMLMLAVKY
jgi:hypothetical protein